jgi:CDP-glucose 4,6-dehydratase
MRSWRGRRVLVTGRYRLQGQLAEPVAARARCRRHGLCAGAAERSEPVRCGADRRALINHHEGDVRDLAAVRAVVEASRPEVDLPSRRAAAGSPVVSRAGRDLRHQCDGHGASARGGAARARREGDRLRHQRQMLREPRMGLALSREAIAMGGHDPYSSSKGCAELVAAAYRSSFFADGPALATVRAGNVIGGGDWAEDRLVPDLVRAFEAGAAPLIRSPDAVRPWQHVLEALGGYLQIAERLMAGERQFADAWNFGPADDDARPVSWIVERMRAVWGDALRPSADQGARVHEAGLLRLDCSKARAALGWRPALNARTSARLDRRMAQGDRAGRRRACHHARADHRLFGGCRPTRHRDRLT